MLERTIQSSRHLLGSCMLRFFFFFKNRKSHSTNQSHSNEQSAYLSLKHTPHTSANANVLIITALYLHYGTPNLKTVQVKTVA